MAEKTFMTRMQQKRATEAQWNEKVNFIPLAGEIIVYEPDGNYNYPRIKVGDGAHTIAALPFIDKAVYDYTDKNIADLGEGFTNVIYQMYGDDLTEEGAPTIREIASDEANDIAESALASAKSYTDEAVAGATEGMVKSVNGVLPNENGEITSHHIINIVLYDNTCYPGGEVLCYTHTAKELVKMFRNTTVRMPIVTRRVAAMSGTYKPDVFLQSFNIVIIDGGYEVHFHYGDEYADIIANNQDVIVIIDEAYID